MATISELRTLVRGCEATMPGGSCTITDECLDCGDPSCVSCPPLAGPANGCYWDDALLGPCTITWTSQMRDASLGLTIAFDNGAIAGLSQVATASTRCVR